MLCNISQNAMGQTPGGYPYPIMLCNITQNSMGQTPGWGYPARSSRGEGTLPGPAGGVPCPGGTLPRGTLPGGYPLGGTLPGGTPLGGTLPGGTQVGYPQAGCPPQPGQDRGYPARGGTQLGQQKEYSLHRWAVCLLRSHRRTFLF